MEIRLNFVVTVDANIPYFEYCILDKCMMERNTGEMNFPVFIKEALAESRYSAIKEHLYSELNGEAVILSLTTGKYYGINAVGVSIWAAVQNPTTFHHNQQKYLASLVSQAW